MREALNPCSSSAALRSSGVLSRMHLSGSATVKITAPVELAVARGDAYCWVADLAVAGLDLVLLLGGERTVLGWPGEGRGPLEHREVARHLGQLGDRLDAGRAVADDADPAALQLDPALGPEAALHDLAREGVEARPVRTVRGRQPTGGHHAEAGAELLAGLRVDDPGVGGFVEGGRRHPGLEADVPAQVVAVGDVVEVALDLGLRREVLAPHPLLLELRVEAEGVLEAGDVAAGAGVAVPVPGARPRRRPARARPPGSPRSRSTFRAYRPDMPAPTTTMSASSSMSVDRHDPPSCIRDGTSIGSTTAPGAVRRDRRRGAGGSLPAAEVPKPLIFSRTAHSATPPSTGLRGPIVLCASTSRHLWDGLTTRTVRPGGSQSEAVAITGGGRRTCLERMARRSAPRSSKLATSRSA